MYIFLKRTFFLSLPIILLITGLEIYIKTSKSAYYLKSKYFKEREYEVLVLGSSHNQNAINPQFLNLPTCNVAMGSQDLTMDLALLKKSIDLCNKLKIVIVEMTYHRFRSNPKNYWRNGIYEHFYDLELSKRLNISKYLLISSNLKFFRNYFGEVISRSNQVHKYNEYGFDENDFDGLFKQLNYDEDKIIKTSKNRLRISNWMDPDTLAIHLNVDNLKEINQICLNRNIKLVLVATPVFKTYSGYFKEQNLTNRIKVIEELRRINPDLLWLNFEQTDSFKVSHFKNDDHLNTDGAHLFTTMLNDSIESNGNFNY